MLAPVMSCDIKTYCRLYPFSPSAECQTHTALRIGWHQHDAPHLPKIIKTSVTLMASEEQYSVCVCVRVCQQNNIIVFMTSHVMANEAGAIRSSYITAAVSPSSPDRPRGNIYDRNPGTISIFLEQTASPAASACCSDVQDSLG